MISRGSKTEARVITVTLTSGEHTGRGEGVPYPRYNETVESSLAGLEAARTDIEAMMPVQSTLTKAASNALDCALWDLRSKQAATPVWKLANLQAPQTSITAYTISLGDPQVMAQAATKASHYPLLKLKLGGDGDSARIKAVRSAVPTTRLVIDANEAWNNSTITDLLKTCAGEGIELVEQPLPATADAMLVDIEHLVPICADESAHDAETLNHLVNRYDAVNIKLDKTGGFTRAIEMARKAQALNLKVMIGCMVSTSLSMAPALHLAQFADWIDLDGPLLLSNDRDHGLVYQAGTIAPPQPALWG